MATNTIQYPDGRTEIVTVPVAFSVGDVLAVTHRRDGGVVVQRVGTTTITYAILQVEYEIYASTGSGVSGQIRMRTVMISNTCEGGFFAWGGDVNPFVASNRSVPVLARETWTPVIEKFDRNTDTYSLIVGGYTHTYPTYNSVLTIGFDNGDLGIKRGAHNWKIRNLKVRNVDTGSIIHTVNLNTPFSTDNWTISKYEAPLVNPTISGGELIFTRSVRVHVTYNTTFAFN